MSIPVQSSKGVSFTEFIGRKCREQPFVPIGALATCGALLGATYHLRKGNRTKFNQFLRLRIYAQGATVVALMIYGGMTLNGDQKGKKPIKLEEIPSESNNTSLASTIPFPKEPITTPFIKDETPTSLPESISTAIDSPPSLSKEGSTGTGNSYPLRKEERMKVSDFARRLKEAEQLHKEEEAVKRASR